MTRAQIEKLHQAGVPLDQAVIRFTPPEIGQAFSDVRLQWLATGSRDYSIEELIAGGSGPEDERKKDIGREYFRMDKLGWSELTALILSEILVVTARTETQPQKIYLVPSSVWALFDWHNSKESRVKSHRRGVVGHIDIRIQLNPHIPRNDMMFTRTNKSAQAEEMAKQDLIEMMKRSPNSPVAKSVLWPVMKAKYPLLGRLAFGRAFREASHITRSNWSNPGRRRNRSTEIETV